MTFERKELHTCLVTTSKMDMETFRARVKLFASQHTDWIYKVGRSALQKSQLSIETFVKGIGSGYINFDELCLLVSCRAFNIHCAVLLEGSYWTTRKNNSFNGCLLRFAYMGDAIFKEISADLDQVEVNSEPSSFDESDNSDLEGTGLLYSEEENATQTHIEASKETGSTEHELVSQTETHIKASKATASNDEQDQHDLPDMDIKPIIKFKPLCHINNEADPIVIDSDSDVDVKPPLIKDKFDFGTDLIVIDSDSEPCGSAKTTSATATTSPQTTVTPRVTSTIASASKNGNYNRIKRTRDYCCYLCQYTFSMQSEFVNHFKTVHPGSKYKCEFCISFFDSANGLFKHERSHIYMKYFCDACQKKFQFPYQLSAHKTQHTGTGKHQCSQCTKSFGSKCSKDFHERTHDLKIKCDLCPMSTEKVFNNKPALLQHQRGLHGPGWTTVCGEKL